MKGLMLVMFLALTACGGGGSSSASPDSTSPDSTSPDPETVLKAGSGIFGKATWG